ncbi:helix-turn-helix domain-containing protein [Lentzea sp. NPDC058450]|uniref:helix-turn-helix domain-containing protein n=1 Tax=Lentzea sp. NPDC058450 TaxID=3346505 RepID=UPI00365D80D0
MSQRDTPVVHQRRLRGELRRLREDKSFTQKYVAEQLEWSVSKIIRIENGSSNVGSTDLKALLELYDVTGPDRVNELLGEARASRKSVWWTRHRPYIDPQFYFFIGIEASAERIRQYQALAMPGLVQTRRYTQALASAVETEEVEIQRGVEIRMRRQGIVTADGPELHFIIDEAVLLRYVDQADVMIEQWEAIVEKAELPNVTVQVLRLGPHVKRAHRGLRGSFSLLKLPDDDAEVLVLEEPLRDVMIRDDRHDIEKYDEAFDVLRELALDKEKSIEFIRELIFDARDSTAKAV